MNVPAALFRQEAFVARIGRSLSTGALLDEIQGFETYCKEHVAYAGSVSAKADRICLLHGRVTGDRRGLAEVESCTALVLDCDGTDQTPDLDPIRSAGISFFYQQRFNEPTSQFKYHLVLPLSSPITVVPSIRHRRLAALPFFERLLSTKFDPSPTAAKGLLAAYTRAAPADPAPVCEYRVTDLALDLDRLLESVGYVEAPHRLATPRGVTLEEEAMAALRHDRLLAAFHTAGLYLRPGRQVGDHYVRCPLMHRNFKGQADTSTLVRGHRIVCMHSRCLHRPQGDFMLHLPPEARAPLMTLRMQALASLLETARVPRLSLTQAQDTIRATLSDFRPGNRDGLVVRVTTGAGKTHLLRDHVERYCVPWLDPVSGELQPGRVAVIGTATNALMDEFRARLTVPYRHRRGVLAVLNEDGTPACRKHPQAKALANAGGNVHRLMCSRCEFKDGCPAREGAAGVDGATEAPGPAQGRGPGPALHITNHALLPSVVRELASSGRVPYVVWDETPELLRVGRLFLTDLHWFLERFEWEAARARHQSFGRMGLGPEHYPIFSPRFRLLMLPIVRVLDHLRRVRADDIAPGFEALEAAARGWMRFRGAQAQVQSAEVVAQLPSGVGTQNAWLRVAALARVAQETDSLQGESTAGGVGFDRLPPDTQELVLRAERVRGFLADMVSSRCLSLEHSIGALTSTCLTENGALWREGGGIVLDATAPERYLRSLREARPTQLVDVRVADAAGARRILVVQDGLTRRNLADPTRRPGQVLRAYAAVQGAIPLPFTASGSARVSRRRGCVLFTFKSLLEDFKKSPITEWLAQACGEVEWAYFGNTRGYDHWYQRGFDTYITIGDPRPNLLDQRTKEAATGVGGYMDELAQAELAQAHGRARTIRTAHCLHLHVGGLVPFDWDSSNCQVEFGADEGSDK